MNVPELIAMFRAFADVVMPEDLRQYVKVPEITTGKGQVLTAAPTPAFKAYQQILETRIKATTRDQIGLHWGSLLPGEGWV